MENKTTNTSKETLFDILKLQEDYGTELEGYIFTRYSGGISEEAEGDEDIATVLYFCDEDGREWNYEVSVGALKSAKLNGEVWEVAAADPLSREEEILELKFYKLTPIVR